MNGSDKVYNLDKFLTTIKDFAGKNAKEIFLSFPPHISYKNMITEVVNGRKVSVRTEQDTTIIINYKSENPSYLTRDSYKEYKKSPIEDVTYLNLLSQFRDEFRQASGQLILELIWQLRQANYKLHDNHIAEKIKEAEVFLEGRW